MISRRPRWRFGLVLKSYIRQAHWKRTPQNLSVRLTGNNHGRCHPSSMVGQFACDHHAMATSCAIRCRTSLRLGNSSDLLGDGLVLVRVSKRSDHGESRFVVVGRVARHSVRAAAQLAVDAKHSNEVSPQSAFRWGLALLDPSHPTRNSRSDEAYPR